MPSGRHREPCCSEPRVMILSGEEIRKHLGGQIVIDPFQESHLNPNSYNLTLHNELLTYEEVVLDMRQQNRVRRLTIPEEGLVLNPTQLYLGRTVERTETHGLVPMIEGRSSVGRLGLFVHVTAGFGDVGFCGFWTLEMFAVQPVRIYPGVAICQIFYHRLDGDYRRLRQRQVSAQPRHSAQHVVQGAESRRRLARPATEAAVRGRDQRLMRQAFGGSFDFRNSTSLSASSEPTRTVRPRTCSFAQEKPHRLYV